MGVAADIAPLPGGRLRRGWPGLERSLQDAFASSCLVMRPPQASGSGFQRQVLVVWQWREADPPSSSGEVPVLATRHKAIVAESRGGLRAGGPRAPSVRLLFRDARAIPALLDFLRDTRVGQMPGQILLAGEDVEGESDLEAIELEPQEEKKDGSSEESEEEDGPAPPDRKSTRLNSSHVVTSRMPSSA